MQRLKDCFSLLLVLLLCVAAGVYIAQTVKPVPPKILPMVVVKPACPKGISI